MKLIGWRTFMYYRNSRMCFMMKFQDFLQRGTIELVPGEAPVSKTSYRMSTPEFLELKM